ncbi:UDP:flavonoid glycosyltransferase YjiC (YdhE family) [Nocardia transvalensis]|uniref:UDP:flavonoid glycosyltransferase YjiC (YdhE family) n=1 Tax=Nocardia transvalensis TaxID=37333 RepID=A0A7W9PJK7_9NOCA|nr:glycosyltransferase [Nocardia transvalensis]MBB5917366.1 UDP:flavonoid glycosyltransferase YjiC (YdhE family) [Nocardia transvalensis]
MKIAVLTYGSRGDLQPPLAAAIRLRERGHHIAVAANADNVEAVTTAGFDVHEIPTDIRAFLRSDIVARLLRSGGQATFTRAFAKMERESGAAVDEALISACAGADIILSGPVTLAVAQCIVERTGQPLVAHMPFPLGRSREYAPPLLTGRTVPTGFLRLTTHRAFQFLYTTTNRASVRRIRRRLGLPDSFPGPFARAEADRTPIELLVSPALFPRPADWPPQYRIAGRPIVPDELRAAWGESSIDPAVDRWLAAGEPPVFVSFGSMPVPDPAGCLTMLAEAARRTGLRILVDAGWSDFALGTHASGAVMVTGASNHDAILGRCRAAIHHGGSGTTQTVAAAGIPAVVTHFGVDQVFWGKRVAAAGLGVELPIKKLTADRLANALRAALTPRVVARAAAVGAAMSAEDGARQLCDTVERTAVSG